MSKKIIIFDSTNLKTAILANSIASNSSDIEIYMPDKIEAKTTNFVLVRGNNEDFSIFLPYCNLDRVYSNLTNNSNIFCVLYISEYQLIYDLIYRRNIHTVEDLKINHSKDFVSLCEPSKYLEFIKFNDIDFIFESRPLDMIFENQFGKLTYMCGPNRIEPSDSHDIMKVDFTIDKDLLTTKMIDINEREVYSINLKLNRTYVKNNNIIAIEESSEYERYLDHYRYESPKLKYIGPMTDCKIMDMVSFDMRSIDKTLSEIYA